MVENGTQNLAKKIWCKKFGDSCVFIFISVIKCLNNFVVSGNKCWMIFCVLMWKKNHGEGNCIHAIYKVGATYLIIVTWYGTCNYNSAYVLTSARCGMLLRSCYGLAPASIHLSVKLIISVVLCSIQWEIKKYQFPQRMAHWRAKGMGKFGPQENFRYVAYACF